MSAAKHHGGHHSHDGHDEHAPRWLNLSLAVVLGVAAIVSGVTAWRGTVLNGHAVENFTLSTQSVNDANSLAQEAERASTSERASLQLEQAHVDLNKSHSLEFIAALLTVTFLLGGLSGVFQSHRAKATLVTASGTALGVCLIAMVTLW